jgi:DNA-binding transcriptional regulator YhcF (GntR family)
VIVALDADSPVPPYEQLRMQIAALITSRSLTAGERLPAIRQLAGDLGAAPGTVARAYRELESQGLIQTRRTGTVIANTPGRVEALAPADRRRRLRQAALNYKTAVGLLGVDPQEALASVRDVLLADGT